MATQSVPPLRVQKGSNASSPTKNMAFTPSRPLSELSPMALRRNSPSFPRNSMSKHDSSPANSSPFNNTTSPRMFWQGRNPNPTSPSSENRSPYDSISPAKRSSIENLKKASRVKNSSMFAKEQQNNYDPSAPRILDGKPLRNSLQGAAFFGRNSFAGSINGANTPNTTTTTTAATTTTTAPNSPTKAESKSTAAMAEKEAVSPLEQLASSPFNPIAPLSPSKSQASPTKSSLSKKTGAMFRRSGFDPSTGIWEDDDSDGKKLPEGKRLHRHAKSVTFDQAPPQINEYEMTTPDPSSIASGSREGSYESFDDDEEEDEYSFDRGSSFDPHDDSFDASLEDTDKTPVVLPEDWRFMSPENANTDLVRDEEDVFDDTLGSPPPDATPGSVVARPHQASVQSIDSNGQTRPLPPLPPQSSTNGEAPSSHRDSLSGTLERMSGTYRALPSPPPAANLTAADIRRMSNGTFSLEDRFKMMAVKDSSPQKTEAETQRERRMRRAGSKDPSPIRDQFKAGMATAAAPAPAPAADEDAEATSESAMDRKPEKAEERRLSRDFITQQLRAGSDDISRSNSQYSSASLDPDVPIPSREDPTQTFDEEYEDDSIVIKDEPVDDDDDVLYKIPEMYRKTSSQLDAEDEATSQYSQSSVQRSVELNAETPRAHTPAQEPKKSLSSDRMSLPDFMHFGQEKEFDFGLGRYISRQSEEPTKQTESAAVPAGPSDLPDLAAVRSNLARPFTPEQPFVPPAPAFSQDETSEPGTPSSVIRHPVHRSTSPENEEDGFSLTKTTSHTASLKSLDDANSNPSSVPSMEADITKETSKHSSLQPTPEAEDSSQNPPTPVEPEKKETGNRTSSLVQLDFPRVEAQDSLGLGLEAEFDRVLEAQKRGYLMRQNTKIVVATERTSLDEPRSPTTSGAPEGLSIPNAAANEVVVSPRKTSQPTWVAEPWNNKSRRRSIRVNGEASPKRKPVEGPAPPLPGQASNVAHDLGAVAEDDLAEEEAEEFEDGSERGRLFVKVVGVKDLQLPFPQQEQTFFALTLDNGLHCVTTSWLNLARDAPIGQEFELIVLNELEFQLTLQMKLEEPPKASVRSESPTKAPVSPKKQNAFGRLFGSPRKKKDSDVRAPEPPAVRRPVTPPSAYELVQGIVAKDGSFARAYVSLAEFEKQAYGRPATVDIKCFNEWAMEEVAIGSSRSKKGVVRLQRRPPYEIGKLELQLLYVPKPKGAKDEDMPKSMNGAIRAMREAEERLKQQSEIKEFDGFLSQQGGDCPYWRRRFFKLVGTKLTAYHETTRQPRATINLAKAAKLIDGKANLAQKEVSTKKGGRRKSAFAEDEEGYMFVEEGFRIRFANGEVIDFYAENAASKDEWMAALSQVVGKQISAPGGSARGWTDMVLKREKSMKAKARPAIPQRKASREKEKELPARPQIEPHQSFQGAMMTGALQAPMSPQQSSIPRPPGHSRTESYQGDMGGPRSQANSPMKPRFGREERHRKTKSMWG